MSAPDDTKVLLDLVYKVRELNQDPKKPILVHCSAGVGRTGTFIAFYKLVIDYMDPRRTNLTVFPTVLQMRNCRPKMVQKEAQYHYIYKCLADYIAAQESDYSNLYEGDGQSLYGHRNGSYDSTEEELAERDEETNV